MPLSAEDTLRLNVMLATRPHAVRIDESRMQVWSLGDKGDARIDLCPNCRDEQYLKQVRELLSGQILGSPGGYPVYIKRWTRMGQMRDDSLEHLLLLGEPEAIIAAVYASGLTNELARRAWWVMEDAENARQMLRKECVVRGSMGPVLAEWLIEFLPFETEAEQMMETLALVLQADLINETSREGLWKKAKRKPTYYVGFLATIPDQLPVQSSPHQKQPGVADCLAELVADENSLAVLLQRVLSARGQAWLHTLEVVLQKPNNQDVVIRTLYVAAEYFKAAHTDGKAELTIEELQSEAWSWLDSDNSELLQLRQRCPTLIDELKSVRALSGLSYAVIRPVLRDSTAIGSLMRKKLAPVFELLLSEVKILRGA